MTIWTPEEQRSEDARNARLRASVAETSRTIAALIDQAGQPTPAPRPNRATRRQHRTR